MPQLLLPLEAVLPTMTLSIEWVIMTRLPVAGC
jgi:hypothetical protein